RHATQLRGATRSVERGAAGRRRADRDPGRDRRGSLAVQAAGVRAAVHVRDLRAGRGAPDPPRYAPRRSRRAHRRNDVADPAPAQGRARPGRARRGCDRRKPRAGRAREPREGSAVMNTREIDASLSLPLELEASIVGARVVEELSTVTVAEVEIACAEDAD